MQHSPGQNDASPAPVSQPRTLFDLTSQDVREALAGRSLILPELEQARAARDELARAPQTRRVLAQTEALLEGLEHVPQTTYSAYRLFREKGERSRYEAAYFLKRARLSAAALRLFLGQTELRAPVQDYLWSVCEESNWVLPAHEKYPIDLFAAETGYLLAESLLLLGETLDAEVRQRVRAEVERRIFEPYLRFFHLHDWYEGTSNWNGVCNSAVAATFLLLEPEAARVQRALEIALHGLRAFVSTAFADDGSSSEGVAYWHYGLFNFVALAEMLYACSGGHINLLAGERLRLIAAFPAQVQLSGSCFASFADCDERVGLHPGILTRLARRSGETTLLHLLPNEEEPDNNWRLPMMVRDMLWWDGSASASLTPQANAFLPAGALARLVAHTREGAPLALCLKAGHNAEEHNHNDIGSFILHVAGENLLIDPGRGLYSRSYFGSERYENIFANSYGHSVPRIDGLLQGTGRACKGVLQAITSSDDFQHIELDFAAAYPSADLVAARREFRLSRRGPASGTIRMRDHLRFAQGSHHIEEAFVTWLDCTLDGPTASLHGQHHTLRLTIEQPSHLHFSLEQLTDQSQANHKPQVLKRLTFTLPVEQEAEVSVRMELLPQ
jgi:hypothetical protein